MAEETLGRTDETSFWFSSLIDSFALEIIKTTFSSGTFLLIDNSNASSMKHTRKEAGIRLAHVDNPITD